MAAREIGGYLELEDFGGAPYHAGAVELDSARSCLAYLIELRGIRAIALPDLMCGAVAEACNRAGCGHRSYRVGEDLLPDWAALELAEGEWLYLADFYGTLHAEAVGRAVAASGGRVVVDEVQGFFRKPWPGADTLYTCRKFFGVPDGAYLVTRDGIRLARELPACRSAGRMAHVLGRCEDGGSAHYGEYSLSEEGVGAGGPQAMSEVTRRLLSGIDYGRVRAARERNFAELHRLLGSENLIDPGKPEGPYMYPFLAASADGARGRLAARGIYVPTLWPSVLAECRDGTAAYRFAADLLPLPVDQRYGIDDMRALAAAVLEETGI